MADTVNVTLTLRSERHSKQEWVESNPILAEGELGFESDDNVFKIGDGITTWNELPYVHIDKLAKPIKIGNAEFDGSKDISLNDIGAVSLDDDIEITGDVKVPTPATDNSIANKKYVDDQILNTRYVKILAKTLSAGDTELIFEDEVITTTADYEYWISKYGTGATDINVEPGKITMSFDSYTEDLIVQVRIKEGSVE